MIDRTVLVSWVRQHRWMSAHTLRRRLSVPRPEADRLIAELVQERVLSRKPEGESYRVLYRRRHYVSSIVRTKSALESRASP